MEPLTPTAGMGMWEEESLDHTGPGQRVLSELLPPLDKGEGLF